MAIASSKQPAGLVAGVGLAGNQDGCGGMAAVLVGEGVQDGIDGGVGGQNPQCKNQDDCQQQYQGNQ